MAPGFKCQGCNGEFFRGRQYSQHHWQCKKGGKFMVQAECEQAEERREAKRCRLQENIPEAAVTEVLDQPPQPPSPEPEDPPPDPKMVSRVGHVRKLPAHLRDLVPSLHRALPAHLQRAATPPPEVLEVDVAQGDEIPPPEELRSMSSLYVTTPDQFGLYRVYPVKPWSGLNTPSLDALCKGGVFDLAMDPPKEPPVLP
ncbi:hypothetical protein C8Q70DRAFT_1058279 [Cubamyces menziesii]|uniref:Uncharacterized protein n=1 Tax=Trametes cubensis TaxID=1111947 RepID=A0AAD7TIX6_9APHY|nr:hypothetical protein C8Q70DRAFT_1058279 [Cubamyces menziesii]KAJ8462725.1 hypothetical protein ONZ51_g10719 [Trametes cubensis]